MENWQIREKIDFRGDFPANSFQNRDFFALSFISRLVQSRLNSELPRKSQIFHENLQKFSRESFESATINVAPKVPIL